MKARTAIAVTAVIPLLALAPPQRGAKPEIVTSDVDRFYALYDSQGGKPTAQQLEEHYLAKASPGLVQFARFRGITAARVASAIADRPDIFVNARRCSEVLPRAVIGIAEALEILAAIYPDATFPPITVAIGRGKPVAAANASGVMVGLEAFCATPVFQSDLEGNFIHLVAHEYAHVLQPAAQVEDPSDPVLKAALIEGGAEFIAELTSGSMVSRHLVAATRGREEEIETAFLQEMDEKASGSRWLYNGFGTADWPGDLGYWVGYRIVKAYYLRSSDKKVAVREIIQLGDPKMFLAKSGWHPGMDID